jgi:hypothetical protein
MKVKISTSNINYFLRQEYGFTSINQFFKYAEQNKKIHDKVIKHAIESFTGYHFKDGKLMTYNPYTDKYESLNITGVNHIHTKEELMKELSMLHKARMKMLEQSRKKVIELSKKKDRDQDLQPQADRRG